MNRLTSNETILSREEEEELVLRAKNGEKDAQNKLWVRLQRLIRAIVNRHISKHDRNLFEDLVNAGYHGVLSALRNYDPSKGAKFTTYAWRFIWKEINREKWRLKGASDEIVNHISAVSKASNGLIQQGITNPDILQIAKKARVSINKAEEIVNFLSALRNTSFDSIEQGGENGLIYELISNKPFPNPTEETEESEAFRKRNWDFQEEDIGFINYRIADHLKNKWVDSDAERCRKFASTVDAPDRCLRRRVVIANGSRGMPDTLILRELNKYASGSQVYDRRALWKEHSQT
jgi:DNA-directed RNA polymerase specialized sigma subunit